MKVIHIVVGANQSYPYAGRGVGFRLVPAAPNAGDYCSAGINVRDVESNFNFIVSSPMPLMAPFNGLVIDFSEPVWDASSPTASKANTFTHWNLYVFDTAEEALVPIPSFTYVQTGFVNPSANSAMPPTLTPDTIYDAIFQTRNYGSTGGVSVLKLDANAVSVDLSYNVLNAGNTTADTDVYVLYRGMELGGFEVTSWLYSETIPKAEFDAGVVTRIIGQKPCLMAFSRATAAGLIIANVLYSRDG